MDLRTRKEILATDFPIKKPRKPKRQMEISKLYYT